MVRLKMVRVGWSLQGFRGLFSLFAVQTKMYMVTLWRRVHWYSLRLRALTRVQDGDLLCLT